jgi:hypothetical protein
MMTVKKSSWWGRVTPHPPNKTEAEITRAAEEKIARAARLSREADKVAGKRHRGRQDDLRVLGMKMRMASPSKGTTPSSIGSAWLVMTNLRPVTDPSQGTQLD